MVTYLGSLVQSCCGEGGTLQTSITGVCGECSQCLGHTGFAPAHSMCAFPVYTAQAPGCSAGELSKVGPGLRAFSRSKQLRFRLLGMHKGADLVGPEFCALPRSEQLRRSVLGDGTVPRWAVHLITSPIPAGQFSGYTMGVPSQVCPVSLLGS